LCLRIKPRLKKKSRSEKSKRLKSNGKMRKRGGLSSGKRNKR